VGPSDITEQGLMTTPGDYLLRASIDQGLPLSLASETLRLARHSSIADLFAYTGQQWVGIVSVRFQVDVHDDRIAVLQQLVDAS
jgi:hypothetical protein